MFNRTLLNLVLLVALGVMVIVMVYEPGLPPEAEKPRLTALDPASIKHIQIKNEERTLNLDRQNENTWTIRHEPPVPAGAQQLKVLLSLLYETPVRSYPVGELDLNKLQLSPASQSIRFNDTEILFGSRESLEGLRYVLLDDQVHLIADNYQQLAQPHITSFASHRLLPKGSNIQSLIMPDKKLILDNEQRWQLLPEQADILADAIQQLVDHWKSSSALWVRPYTNPTSTTQVKVQTDTELISFDIISEDGELILGRADLGLQYHFSAASAKQLMRLEPATPDED